MKYMIYHYKYVELVKSFHPQKSIKRSNEILVRLRTDLYTWIEQ